MKFLAKYILSALLLTVVGLTARAFDASVYAPSSELASGNWVKISVSETGLHLLSVSDLRSMGFSDPSKVRVYGYGGRRIPDQFTLENYRDDLPLVQSAVTSRGVVFYAVAAETEREAAEGYKYHTLNPYSAKGYYFVTDNGAEPRSIPVEGRAEGGSSPATDFIQTLRHERDVYSPAESGHTLLGEDFRFTRTQTFTFSMPDRVEGTEVWAQAEMFGKIIGSPATVTLSANGQRASQGTLPTTDEYGETCTVAGTFTPSGTSLSLELAVKSPGTTNVIGLDHISVCYRRALSLPSSGALEFTSSTIPLVAGATASTHVWDVTDPLSVKAMNTLASGAGLTWNNDYYGQRRYVAWNENATLPAPVSVGKVTAQNLHGHATPEMVIVSHPDLVAQANRIARAHENEGLEVFVVTPDKIYNEFSSGTPDVNAIRRMLKMFRDRGPSTPGKELKYLLMMGGMTFDMRGVTSASKGTYLPGWQTDNSLSSGSSFSSDDPLTFLEDNSGLFNGSDMMSIAVGRIPARNASAAKVYTDRLLSYMESPQSGIWRNRIVLLADDEDAAVHLTQTEELEQMMRSYPSGDNIVYNKVYLDAYEEIGGVTVVGRNKLHNLLNEGVLWFNYIGHASITALSGEGVLTYIDLSKFYLRRPPFFYGATCSFAHIDGSELSGLEMLMMDDSGGFVGGISAVRPVYITRNGVLSNAMGTEVFARDADGRIRPVAEAMRRAKNRVNDTNKMRYITLCDPAMRLAVPSNYVTLTHVGGVAVDDADRDAILPALAPTVLKGAVTDHEGHVLSDFNGTVSLTLYDAERSFTTLGRGEDGVEKVFDEQGDRVFAGVAPVKDGLWETTVVLPSEIADNFRPATLTMFGQSDDKAVEAAGTSRQLYVYGISDDGFADLNAPVIESIYLNHESFEPDKAVNAAPMLIARVSDDIGFNLSGTGVGHEMTIRIDDVTNLNDVADSFTPDLDGSAAGSITYQLPELAPGNHTATLRVWDVGGNFATASVEFFVDPSVAPKIFDMYSDANPATEQANFYIIHNRPEAMLTVEVEVFDLAGRRLWTSTGTGRADMYSSQPVTWNLTTGGGQRVGRGIYLYRATVTEQGSGGASSSMTKRIAVR